MKSYLSVTLWTDAARTRYFLIPDDKEFPSGDFTLRTLTGRKMKIEEGSLAEFELSEEEAKEWLRGEFGKMLDGARAAVDRFVKKLSEGPSDSAEEPKTSDD